MRRPDIPLDRPCRVPGCPALAAWPDPAPRGVCTIGICLVHQSLPDDALRVLLARQVGMVAPLRPVTDRIEYEP